MSGDTEIIGTALAKKFEQNPQVDYLWRVVLPDLDTFVDPSGSGAMNAYINQYVTPQQGNSQLMTSLAPKGPTLAEDISLRVYDITVPFISFSSRKSMDATKFRYAAEHGDIGTLQLSVDEFEDGLTLRYFTAWMDLIQNPDGSRNPPAYYKKNITFIKRTMSQTDSHFTTYQRFFPTEIAPLQYNYDGSQISQYSITLTGDGVKHTHYTRDQYDPRASQERGRILTQKIRT